VQQATIAHLDVEIKAPAPADPPKPYLYWRNPPRRFYSAQEVTDGMRDELKRRGLSESVTKRTLRRLFSSD
jgi:hypothetical protein